MIEVWKEIPGFSGWYDVSDQGRVRSWHLNKWGRRDEPRQLKARIDRKGYPYVFLYLDGQYRRGKVHKLVMLAFGGPVPEGMEVCHNNGVKADNRFGNLRYDTPSGNQQDRIAHGSHNRGERMGAHKLSLTQVEMICSLYAAGVTQRAIAARFGVDQGHVSAIVNGKKWGWRTEAADEFHARTAT